MSPESDKDNELIVTICALLDKGKANLKLQQILMAKLLSTLEEYDKLRQKSPRRLRSHRTA
jgi:hypothetical protein